MGYECTTMFFYYHKELLEHAELVMMHLILPPQMYFSLQWSFCDPALGQWRSWELPFKPPTQTALWLKMPFEDALVWHPVFLLVSSHIMCTQVIPESVGNIFQTVIEDYHTTGLGLIREVNGLDKICSLCLGLGQATKVANWLSIVDAGSVEGSGPPFKHPRSTPHTGGLVLDNEGEQPTSGKYGILKCLYIPQHELNSSLCRYTVK
jgi:hypothetical protein